MNLEECRILMRDFFSSVSEFTKTEEYLEIAKAIRRIIEIIDKEMNKEPIDLHTALAFEFDYLQAKLKLNKDPLCIPLLESGLNRIIEAKCCLEQSDDVTSYYCAASAHPLKDFDSLGLLKDSFRQAMKEHIKSLKKERNALLLPCQKELMDARIGLIKKLESAYKERQISLMVSIAKNNPESFVAANFVNKLSSGRITSAKKTNSGTAFQSKTAIEQGRTSTVLQKMIRLR